MKKTYLGVLIITIISSVVVAGCEDETVEPQPPFQYISGWYDVIAEGYTIDREDGMVLDSMSLRLFVYEHPNSLAGQLVINNEIWPFTSGGASGKDTYYNDKRLNEYIMYFDDGEIGWDFRFDVDPYTGSFEGRLVKYRMDSYQNLAVYDDVLGAMRQ